MDDEFIGTSIELPFFADGAFGHKVGMKLDDAYLKPGVLTWLVSFSIHCRTRDEYGFPTPEEQPALQDVPVKALEICSRLGGRYFLRTSSNGVRTFWFYCKDGPQAVREIRDGYRAGSDYIPVVKCRSDPEWTFYFEEVAPLPGFELEKQMLLAVLQELHDQGDALTKARSFDHGLRFPDEKDADNFSRWAIAKGFSVRPAHFDEDSRRYFVDIARNDVPDWKFVNGTLYELVLAAARFGGAYSSNGCMAVLENKPKQ
jgi:hypothetical protein